MTAGQALAFFPLLVATISDCKYRIISDSTVFLVIGCAALDVSTGAQSAIHALIGLLTIGLPLLCFAVWGGGIGGGDVKLCMAMALLLGTSKMLWLLTVALLLFVLFGKIQKADLLPFAPAIWGAFLIVEGFQIIHTL